MLRDWRWLQVLPWLKQPVKCRQLVMLPEPMRPLPGSFLAHQGRLAQVSFPEPRPLAHPVLRLSPGQPEPLVTPQHQQATWPYQRATPRHQQATSLDLSRAGRTEPGRNRPPR